MLPDRCSAHQAGAHCPYDITPFKGSDPQLEQGFPSGTATHAVTFVNYLDFAYVPRPLHLSPPSRNTTPPARLSDPLAAYPADLMNHISHLR